MFLGPRPRSPDRYMLHHIVASSMYPCESIGAKFVERELHINSNNKREKKKHKKHARALSKFPESSSTDVPFVAVSGTDICCTLISVIAMAMC